jgi:hypothetical protein
MVHPPQLASYFSGPCFFRLGMDDDGGGDGKEEKSLKWLKWLVCWIV